MVPRLSGGFQHSVEGRSYTISLPNLRATALRTVCQFLISSIICFISSVLIPIARGLLQPVLKHLELVLDVVEAEVHDEVDHGISKPLHALLHLKALGELVGIGAHAGREGLDLDVGMVAEILARIKRSLLRLLHGFGEDAVVEGIGEDELVPGRS